MGDPDVARTRPRSCRRRWSEPLDWPDATLASGDAVDVVARLKEESDVPLRSHGSLSMNRALMTAGLVDCVQVTLFPVITGENGAGPDLPGRRRFRPRADRQQDAGPRYPGADLPADPARFSRCVIRRPGRRASGRVVGRSPTTSVAIVNVSADGSTTLYCGTVDMGQGSDTAMAQMVGEVLNMPAESVRVVPRDTDVTPYDMGTLGSRSLFHMGHAVRLAAEEARTKIGDLRRELGEPEGSNAPLADLFRKKYGMQAGNIVGTGIYKPDYIPPDANGLTTNATPFWMVAGSGVEIEVDTETGHVRITRLINVADVGKPINPKIVETQLSGASLMQLGFSMFEKMHIDGGQVTNASLADYKIPGMHDVPPVMENEAVDTYQSNGPFGAKGVGELATFGLSPAIANAIDDAVGVRLTELPLTAEAVFRALRAKDNKPLGDE